MRGEGPLANTEQYALNVKEWHDAAQPVRLYRSLREAQSRVQEAESGVRSAEYVGEEGRLREARQIHATALQDLGRIMRTMDQSGVRTPQLPEEWIKQMDALGISYTHFSTPSVSTVSVTATGGGRKKN